MKKPYIAYGRTWMLAALLFLGLHDHAQARWYKYEGCKLLPNRSNDGDSLHVKTKSGEKIFRLYFVDAPETDTSIEGRVATQAEYWGVDEKRTLELGKAATKYTESLLSDEFTVHSQRHDAMGRSDLPRFYGMIEVDGKFLSMELVRQGLARIYGRNTDLPSGKKAWKYIADLKVAERAAKHEQLGGWANRSEVDVPEEKEVFEERDLLTDKRIGVYSLGVQPRFIGFLSKGKEIRVLAAESKEWARIRFRVGQESREGQCRRSDLGL